MIDLLSQIQIIFISFFVGLFASWIWDYIYQIFFKKHYFLIRLLELILYMCFISVLLFYLLFITTDAYLTVYIPLFLLFGIYTYFILYYDYVYKHIEKISKKIEKVKLKIYNLFVRMKKRWKNGTSRKKKKKHLDNTKN